jgi:hypothetical protein
MPRERIGVWFADQGKLRRLTSCFPTASAPQDPFFCQRFRWRLAGALEGDHEWHLRPVFAVLPFNTRSFKGSANPITGRIFQIRMSHQCVSPSRPGFVGQESPSSFPITQRRGSFDAQSIWSANGDQPIGGRTDRHIHFHQEWRATPTTRWVQLPVPRCKRCGQRRHDAPRFAYRLPRRQGFDPQRHNITRLQDPPVLVIGPNARLYAGGMQQQCHFPCVRARKRFIQKRSFDSPAVTLQDHPPHIERRLQGRGEPKLDPKQVLWNRIPRWMNPRRWARADCRYAQCRQSKRCPACGGHGAARLAKSGYPSSPRSN